MAAGLFIISILALIASASATSCSTVSSGSLTDFPVIVTDRTVPAGAFIKEVQNPCSEGMYEVGVKAVGCSDMGSVEVVVNDLQHIYINSDYGAQLTVTGYCFTELAGREASAPLLM